MCVYRTREDAHHYIIIVGLTRCTVPGIDCATQAPVTRKLSKSIKSIFFFFFLQLPNPLQRLYHHLLHSLHRNIFPHLPFLPSLSPHSFGSSSSSSSSKQRPPLLISLFPTMDTLVARYSRSPFENEGFSSDDQHDYTDTLPPLSLRFALPPVARVSHLLPPPVLGKAGATLVWGDDTDQALFFSLCY
jgi:hypothetical protein